MCKNSFEELKNALLINSPLFVYPDWEKGNFKLMTDANRNNSFSGGSFWGPTDHMLVEPLTKRKQIIVLFRKSF